MPKDQLQIPGTERKSNAKVEEAAEELRKLRNKRIKLQTDEKAAATRLKEVLKKEGIAEYSYEDPDEDEKLLDVILDSTEKVYVRRHKEPEEDEE